MTDVAFWGRGDDPALAGFKEALRTEWLRRGYEFVEGADPSAAVRVQLREPGRSQAVPAPPALDLRDRGAHGAQAPATCCGTSTRCSCARSQTWPC